MSPGRPTKYDEIDLEYVGRLVAKGLTDEQLSEVLGISRSTLNNWKAEHAEFLDTIKNNKPIADGAVVRSLFERATGYEHPDVHISNYEGEVTITPIIKHYPPETLACMYWLNNRMQKEWKAKRGNDDDGDIDKAQIIRVDIIEDNDRNSKPVQSATEAVPNTETTNKEEN